MEVREIVETVIKDPLLEVRFRMSTDTDEVIRIAEFDLQEIEDYGYNVITEDFDLFDFDDDEWEDGDVEMDDDESLEIDEDESKVNVLMINSWLITKTTKVFNLKSLNRKLIVLENLVNKKVMLRQHLPQQLVVGVQDIHQ